MPTPQEYQAEILAEIGDNPVTAKFSLLLPIATSAGTWTTTILGEVTSGLAYNATPAAVQAEIEEIVGAGNASVTGQRKGPYFLEIKGELVGQPITLPTASGSGLTPSASLVWVEEQSPQLPVYAEACAALWTKYAYESNNELRKARVKLELLERESGRLKEKVDQDDGQESYDASQKFKANEQILARTRQQITALELKALAGTANASRHGTVVVHSTARTNYTNWRRGLG